MNRTTKWLLSTCCCGQANSLSLEKKKSHLDWKCVFLRKREIVWEINVKGRRTDLIVSSTAGPLCSFHNKVWWGTHGVAVVTHNSGHILPAALRTLFTAHNVSWLTFPDHNIYSTVLLCECRQIWLRLSIWFSVVNESELGTEGVWQKWQGSNYRT